MENINIEHWGADSLQRHDSYSLKTPAVNSNDKDGSIIENLSNKDLIDGFRESTNYGDFLDVMVIIKNILIHIKFLKNHH